MNDFTKEELEYLLEITDSIPIVNEKYNGDYYVYRLQDKIQSMIDNYCEHENLEFIGDVYGYRCKKCEKQLDDSVIDGEGHARAIGVSGE